MPNPVTQSLIGQLSDPALTTFVAHWDALEALVIRIYRSKSATPEDEAEHRRVRAWLQEIYPRWETALAPHWRRTKVADEPVTQDPFARLMGVQEARDWVENWPAMQTLPAAREALNRLLLERLEKEQSQNT